MEHSSAAASPIPVELTLSGRELTEPCVSPDGRHVSIVVRWGTAGGIVVVPVEGGPERLVTTGPAPAAGRGFGGGCTAWLPDGSAIVYAAGDGDLWLQLLGAQPPVPVTDLASGGATDRTARAPSVAAGEAGDAGGAAAPPVLAYQVDDAEVWLVTVGSPALAARVDDASADFCFDPHVRRLGPAERGDGATHEVRWQAWSVPHMPWDAAHVEIVRVVAAPGGDEPARVVGRARRRGAGAIQQPGALADGTPVEVRDDTGWLNVWIGDSPAVAEACEHAGPTWGTGQRSFALSPDERWLAFTRNEAGFGRLCVLDRRSGTTTAVARGVHGQLTWRGDHLVALRSGARTPTQVVSHAIGDGGAGAPVAGARTVLAVGPAHGWDTAVLPEPELVEVAHAGTVVPARRYGAGHGRVICWIHGGPTDQWQVTFMPRITHWWSRGWDVVVPDPRGTTGHGRAHQQALHGEWGRADVDDVAAVVRHAHEAGWSTPATTVVMGGSSGGLTVLGMLADHRALVAGGVALYPVSDLADLAERSHRFEAHYTLTLVGPLDDQERYAARSPVTWADRIGGPLLILHGDADPVVPVEQSVVLAERIRAAGGDVELRIFEGEKHGFRDAGNRRAEHDLIDRFLERVVLDRLAAGDH